MAAYHAPFAVRVLAREVERDGEDVDVGKRLCERPTPGFDVGPICRGSAGLVDIKHGRVQWRLNPTPTCGAMLESKNVSSMAS